MPASFSGKQGAANQGNATLTIIGLGLGLRLAPTLALGGEGTEVQAWVSTRGRRGCGDMIASLTLHSLVWLGSGFGGSGFGGEMSTFGFRGVRVQGPGLRLKLFIPSVNGNRTPHSRLKLSGYHGRGESSSIHS